MLSILRIACSDVSIHIRHAGILNIPYYPRASVGRTWWDSEACNQGARAWKGWLKRVGYRCKGFIRKLQERTAFITKRILVSVETIISKVSISLEWAALHC